MQQQIKRSSRQEGFVHQKSIPQYVAQHCSQVLWAPIHASADRCDTLFYWAGSTRFASYVLTNDGVWNWQSQRRSAWTQKRNPGDSRVTGADSLASAASSSETLAVDYLVDKTSVNVDSVHSGKILNVFQR